MNDFDPTTMLREGVRMAEARYQAEILFRNRLADESTESAEKVSRIAKMSIRDACLFEQEWMVASMREEDTRPDSVAEDEPVRIFEVEPNK
jgi:hypothetical protein